MIFIGLAFIKLVVVSAIMGAVLVLIAPLTANRKPDFEEAFKAMFIAFICQIIAGVVLALVMIDSDQTSIEAISAIVGFVVLTIVLCYTIEATVPRAALTAVALILVGTLLMIGWEALKAEMLSTGGTSMARPILEGLALAT